MLDFPQLEREAYRYGWMIGRIAWINRTARKVA